MSAGHRRPDRPGITRFRSRRSRLTLAASIRPYASTDLEACRGLWRELTQRHRDLYDDPEIGGNDPGVWFDEHLQHPHLAGIWVAESQGTVVGFCGLLVQGQEAEVEPVVVTAAQRSRGVGRRLLHEMVSEARARDIRYLWIRPVARNVEALRLFHDAGFRVLGRVDMLMDLFPEAPRRRPGISIHGRDFEY